MASRTPAAMMQRLPLPDWAWAIIFGVASVGYFLLTIATGTSFFEPNGGPMVSAESVWGSVAVFAVQAVPLVWRSRLPVLSFTLVFVAFLAAIAISIDRNLTVTPTLLFAIFNVAALTSRRTWAVLLGAAFIVDFAIHLTLAVMSIGSLPPVAILATLIRIVPSYVTPILAGLLYGSQRRRAELAAAAGDALRAARDGQLAAAVAAERNRMARELHDVAAHHLSGILLQTKAAIRVQTSDPATTAELLGSINSEGELTLQNLREVVGVLRDAEESGEVAQPTLSRLPDLIDSVRTLHPTIDLTVAGDIDDLSPATSLACYRIIQESLTNVRKHASGAYVAITIDRTARDVVVNVSNTAPRLSAVTSRPSRPGFGVVGMRERATMLGGDLVSGITRDGGWQTRAVIPIERRSLA